jgi:methionyl-tRNA synthetase
VRTTITTAIAYVNAEPHVGFAFELLIADVLARSRSDVRLQTGTDENSLKNVRAAEAAHVPIRELVDRNAAAFERLVDRLGVRCDRFIRTSADPDHAIAVEKLWRACEASGDLYRGRYEGAYCVGCEQFVSERDLVGGRCNEHDAPPERIEEDNVYFRLTKYVEPIRSAVASGRIEIVPSHARAEVLEALDGVRDLSVSRPADRAGGWGLRVPGDPSQVVYVWFDALANYIAGAGYGTDDAAFERWWSSAERVHVIGTGILRFHAVYWPAFLLSAGLPLPTSIRVHGYLTADGKKIGKSNGNAIDPIALIDRYGDEGLRHLLLRHVRTVGGGDLSIERLDRLYEADLADGLGNLVSRWAKLAATAGIPIPEDRIDPAYGSDPRALVSEVPRHVGAFALDEGLASIAAEVDRANRYIQATEPWRLAKGSTRLAEVLGTGRVTLSSISTALGPFLPKTSIEIARRIGGGSGGPLFPRLARRPVHS